MLSTYTEKNNYGGYTNHIKLDSLFHIFIHGTESDSYVVEFKEWKWFNYKTRFSFVSNSDMETTTIKAFDKVHDYFQHKGDYLWTTSQKETKLNQVLVLMKK